MKEKIKSEKQLSSEGRQGPGNLETLDHLHACLRDELREKGTRKYIRDALQEKERIPEPDTPHEKQS